MAKNFITNNKQHKTLKNRLSTLISISDELKFLVGFFYFSGWKELFSSLKEKPELKLKLLIGLQVDQILNKIVEHGGHEEDLSQDEVFNKFITSMGKAINNEEMDTEEFYSQVEFFLSMLEEGRLIIRKTENPNHAKIYLFKLNEEQAHLQNLDGMFITGSSNLTRAGLSGQEEFNVEIKDYGFNEANEYFDELWESAIPISEIEDRKEFLVKFIQHKTQVANVTPFEAYALVLKTYLDLRQNDELRHDVVGFLDKIGYKKYSYQLDAVNQALKIINEYNGVIIADVVGLGKSVIASLIAKNLGKRGMVICPPGLMGNKQKGGGWYGYLNDFELFDWEVESRGTLETIAETIDNRNIEVVIVDEAHYFRNQDTTDYEYLSSICNNRIVILLTATPFNNSPGDIFALLKLFILPGKSSISLSDDLQSEFSAYNYEYKRLSDIIKNFNSKNSEKKRKAETLYQAMFGLSLPVDAKLVRQRTKLLADRIKNTISNVLIRRNRLDLKKDFEYAKEVKDLSVVDEPEELFYYFTPEQSEFYNKILNHYFAEDGRFSGAIYQPFSYDKTIEEEKLDEAGNRAYQQQRNLYDFMRRLLVKRLESSFGAFSKSIDRFLYVHQLVRSFINKSDGKYILDRSLIEKMMQYEEEGIEDALINYAANVDNKKRPKNDTIYNIKKFERKDDFIADIDKDIIVFQEIKDDIEKLKLVENDPKREGVLNVIKESLKKDPNRKIILFSEYVDTVKHLEDYFRKNYGPRVLVCDGKISETMRVDLDTDFNAQNPKNRTNHFDILITSDKLSEGFNLNRAGIIINYDIPWNPTRVIQRVGRINRIGSKVFDKLSIFNFFPSEIGADIVKSREIAEQKMYLIHSALGEDAKIFDVDEQPSPSALYQKINHNPDDDTEVNIITTIRNEYHKIEKNHPEIINKISNLPNRVKTAKAYQNYQLNLLRKKGLSLFSQTLEYDQDKPKREEIVFDDFIKNIACPFDEEKLNLSDKFWENYEELKKPVKANKASYNEKSLEFKALSNLNVYRKIGDFKEEKLFDFVNTLILDIKKYHSLSDKTLRRLGATELTNASSKKIIEEFRQELLLTRKLLKDDYLEILLKRVEGQSNEVIIAIENQ